VSPTLTFPDILQKEALECRVLLEDQIIIIDVRFISILQLRILNDRQDFLSVEECKRFVKFIDNAPLELTPPKKKGEAERVNCKLHQPLVCTRKNRCSPALLTVVRFSVNSVSFAQKLHSILLPHLPSFPPPTSVRRRPLLDEKRSPHSCNSNIRMYKYTPSQYFGPHYDDSVRDPETEAKSEWTMLIYLTGIEDGVEGGEVTIRDYDCKSQD
jgi:hypothetical protein